MNVKPILKQHLFDDDDEDYEDYDDFLDSPGSDDEMPTLCSLTEEAHLTKRTAKKELQKLKDWFNEQLKVYSPDSLHKAAVCDCFCRYAKEHTLDTDDYYFWCLCMSLYSSFLFFRTEEYEQDDELLQYMLLKKEIAENIRRFKLERMYDSIYPGFLKNIIYSYQQESVAVISIDKIIDTVSDVINVEDSEILRDNLECLTEKITHSAKLFELAPLIYYAAFTRYRKKMLCSTDYDMNICNALKSISYVIDEDNGKNIDNYIRHVDLYIALRDSLVSESDKRMVCDYIFCRMSNICECRFIDWNTASLIRPLRLTYPDEGMTVFPNGLMDNPFYKDGNIAYDDVIGYEEYDEKKKGIHILPKIRDYLYNNTDVCMSYIEMLKDSENDECTQLIDGIINRAGMMKHIKPNMLALVHAVVMSELMSVVDEVMTERLISCMDKFNESETDLGGFSWLDDAEEDKEDDTTHENNMGEATDLDKIVGRHFTKIFEQVKSEAEAGRVRSMFSLGLRYIAGGNHWEQDIDEGRKWLEFAAMHNDTDSMAILGYLCYREYTKESLTEAVKWLNCAADNCDTDAMLFLAEKIYLSDDYHLSDFYNEEKAMRLLKRASELGNRTATLYLAALSSSDSEAAKMYIRYANQYSLQKEEE